MKKLLYLLISGVVICAVITACGNDRDSGNKTGIAAVEKEDVSNTEVSVKNATDKILSIPGIWQTVSAGYDYEDSIQPEYYVRFTDSEIQYGHMKDGGFSLDYSDKINTIKLIDDGGFRIQAENSAGFKYTYQTSEQDSTILDYYGTWDENEFIETYSGSSSLISCENKEDDNDQDSFPTEQTKKTEVSADYLDDVKTLYPDYVDASETMKVSSSEYETMVLFHTDGNVEDFRVYSLELNFDENGSVDFIPTEVFRSSELRKDAPIAVLLYFPGDMSLNGFCYKDSDGSLRTYTIGISGMDGSLVINAESFAVPEQ